MHRTLFKANLTFLDHQEPSMLPKRCSHEIKLGRAHLYLDRKLRLLALREGVPTYEVSDPQIRLRKAFRTVSQSPL